MSTDGHLYVNSFSRSVPFNMCSLPWKVSDSELFRTRVEGKMPRITPAQTLNVTRAASALFFPKQVPEETGPVGESL